MWLEVVSKDVTVERVRERGKARTAEVGSTAGRSV